jgi:hypothetical protein
LTIKGDCFGIQNPIEPESSDTQKQKERPVYGRIMGEWGGCFLIHRSLFSDFELWFWECATKAASFLVSEVLAEAHAAEVGLHVLAEELALIVEQEGAGYEDADTPQRAERGDGESGGFGQEDVFGALGGLFLGGGQKNASMIVAETMTKSAAALLWLWFPSSGGPWAKADDPSSRKASKNEASALPSSPSC